MPFSKFSSFNIFNPLFHSFFDFIVSCVTKHVFLKRNLSFNNYLISVLFDYFLISLHRHNCNEEINVNEVENVNAMMVVITTLMSLLPLVPVLLLLLLILDTSQTYFKFRYGLLLFNDD